MRTIDFYQPHLDRVSRSFALCIQKLPEPLRDHVSLSYLLCRVLDTVEDSPWPDAAVRTAQYDALEDFVAALPTPDAVASWAARFPSAIPEGERVLLGDAHALFEELHALPAPVAASIRETVLCMAGGMRHYAERASVDGALRLSHLVEVNQYCYFVAGIVGRLLTRLLDTEEPELRVTPELARDAIHFGLFLQKVNVLKDQREDEREGRFLVPDRAVLLGSLRENGAGALRYLTALPPGALGYRTFCAWSLFLGLASLPFITAGEKIPRSATLDLLATVEAFAGDNSKLLQAGQDALEQLPELGVIAPSPADAAFARLSGSALTHEDLVLLRLL